MKAKLDSGLMLADYNVTLGAKCVRPNRFTVEAAWATPRYSFQLDLTHMVGRRISSHDSSPAIYFELSPITKRRMRPSFSTQSLRMLKVGLITTGAAAAFLLIYPFYPAAQYQVQKKVATTISHTSALASTPSEVSTSNRIIIPKIGVDSAVLEGKSLAILNKEDGIWHETGNETSNIVLAGHRFKYLPPNSTTLYNLDKVSSGDTIVLDWYHKRYIYVVSGTETVTKTDIAIRNPTPTPTLTIYSCEEKNQAHRIVVHAKLIQ